MPLLPYGVIHVSSSLIKESQCVRELGDATTCARTSTPPEQNDKEDENSLRRNRSVLRFSKTGEERSDQSPFHLR